MSSARRVWVGVSVFLLVATVMGVAFQRSIRITYHKRGLQTAKADSARLRQYGPGRMDELKSLFRDTPWTSQACAAAAQRHAEALVKLGFLRRAQYSIDNSEFTAKDRMMQELERMNARCPWWTYSVPAGASNVMIIACARGLSEWEDKAENLTALAETCCSREQQLAARSVAEYEGF